MNYQAILLPNHLKQPKETILHLLYKTNYFFALFAAVQKMKLQNSLHGLAQVFLQVKKIVTLRI